MNYSEQGILPNEEIKSILSQILFDFANYCEENNLRYTLAFGTLLGAVRHKGFIPWDDDIDVFMPRDDYNRLHELIKAKPLKSNYRLESLLAGNDDYPFAKIVDTNTKIVNSKSSFLNHLWIDIFPLDGITNKQAQHIGRLQRITTLWIRLMGKAARKIEWCGLKTTAIILIAHIHPTKYYGKKLDAIAKRNKIEDCEYAADIAWGAAYKYLEKELYLNTCKLEFEGNLYNAPKDYDKVLKRIYGDTYMQLPPEDQRDTHNIEVVKISDNAGDNNE